jgi:PhzF family phenazine biosynthesis protein
MRYCLVDTFAGPAHLGNPAAVVPLRAFPGDAVMQEVAHRINVPTTAFVVPVAAGRYRVRWFTPFAEINLCGHATIAGARHLFRQPGNRGRHRLVFESGNGVLSAERVRDLIAIELPKAGLTRCAPPAGLLEALGVDSARSCARSHDDVLVELATTAEVAAVAPDFAALGRQPFRGHIVTAPAGPDVDFVSRTFFPALGVNEDQVCVSAHCKLAPFWAERLGRSVLTALQVSERGGRLEVENRAHTVRVLGSAVPRGGFRELALDAIGVH